MSLTVAIKCHHDRRIFTCVASIPLGAEIIVLLSTGDPLEHELGAMGIQTKVVHENDLGMRCNAAIEYAQYDRILLLDSDCVVEDGCIDAIDRALDINPVVRARLRVRDDHTWWTRAIARWREYENNTEPVPAFMPGLGIHRRILGIIPPPLFSDGLRFSEDDALNTRLTRHGIRTVLVPGACVVHDSVTLQHFLTTGHRTGQGTSRQVVAGLRPDFERPRLMFGSFIRFRWLRVFWKWVRGAGIPAAAAAVIWHFEFYKGYYSERRGISKGVR